jgi:uncharacterized membrane protein (DUF4010 family)
MSPMDELPGLLVALGVGLLVGIERERSKGAGGSRRAAGVRTFALIALAGSIGALLDEVGIAVGGAFVALAALASYRHSRSQDPGLTTEVAMLVVFLLGVLAMRQVALAAGIGVAVAILLAAKSRLHRFAGQLLSEEELHDGLLLAAAAAIVLPLLPDRALDPWQVLNLRQLWTLAVIVMAINAAGHVALRLFGVRRGLLLAGFAGGFVSSTATIASLGSRAQQAPALTSACASAALLSNVSTVAQLALLTGVLAPGLLRALAVPLLAAGVAIVVVSVVAGRRGRKHPAAAGVAIGRPFQPRHALVFVAVVAGVMLLSAIMLQWLGPAALNATLAVSGIADVHAAALGAARLVAVGRIDAATAVPAVLAAFATNSTSKLVFAFVSGGRSYGLRLVPGIVLMVAAFAVAAWLQ